MVHEREDNVTCGPIMPQGGIQVIYPNVVITQGLFYISFYGCNLFMFVLSFSVFPDRFFLPSLML